jgi:hypothetical protein
MLQHWPMQDGTLHSHAVDARARQFRHHVPTFRFPSFQGRHDLMGPTSQIELIGPKDSTTLKKMFNRRKALGSAPLPTRSDQDTVMITRNAMRGVTATIIGYNRRKRRPFQFAGKAIVASRIVFRMDRTHSEHESRRVSCGSSYPATQNKALDRALVRGVTRLIPRANPNLDQGEFGNRSRSCATTDRIGPLAGKQSWRKAFPCINRRSTCGSLGATRSSGAIRYRKEPM